MTILVNASYDPATAVTKVTSAALAMTALDTTNLRATFTAPASGNVLAQLRCNVHGAATFPQILLGVMNGATVLARCPTSQTVGGTYVATTMVCLEALAPVTGLTPGSSYSLDAAYGVETLVAATGIKYGGPNNATANDAWGQFTFIIWSA